MNSGKHDYCLNICNCTLCYIDKFTFNSFLSDFNNIKVKIPFISLLLSNHFHALSNSNFCFNIYYQNVRGLYTKLFNLRIDFILLFYDVYILTETWLSDDISNAKLGFNGLFNF